MNRLAQLVGAATKKIIIMMNDTKSNMNTKKQKKCRRPPIKIIY